MAFPTALNSQITDSVSEVNLKVLADAPALASAEVYVATSQALANAAHNATTGQSQTNLTAHASLVQSVATLFSLDIATTGIGTQKIL
ncbi:MAG: RebB family R body protein [Verrucomicrobia bacterium]|nr:RebB family R body protein [Verrucomicrobiota bacterium]